MSSGRWASKPGAGRIYTLADPRTSLIRYVGATTTTLSSRLRAHVVATRPDAYGEFRTAPVVAWVSELLAQGLQPLITELRVADTSALAQAERNEIYRHYQAGWPLLNVVGVPMGSPGSAILAKRVDLLRPHGGPLLAEAETHLAAARVEEAEWALAKAEADRRDPTDPNLFEAAARLMVDDWNLKAHGHPFRDPLDEAGQARAVLAMVEIATVAHRHGVPFSAIARDVFFARAIWGHLRQPAA